MQQKLHTVKFNNCRELFLKELFNYTYNKEKSIEILKIWKTNE